MINFIAKKNIGLGFSIFLFVLALGAIIMFGLKPGMDFTGGSLLEIRFTEQRPSVQEIDETLKPLNLGNIITQPTEKNGYIFKLKYISEEEHQNILTNLRNKFEKTNNQTTIGSGTTKPNENSEATNTGVGNKVLEERLETIGPAISKELKSKTTKAIIFVNLAIIAFVAYAFRKVSRPLQSWKYGVTAVVALIHDVTITTGVFAILGKYYGVEVDIPFIVALLTILGYSVNDTIVVFDRIRENLIRKSSENFPILVNNALNETLMRSVNTTFTTLLALLALFIFGGETIKYFSLALVIGIFLGAYSSIFVASPIMVVWEKWGKRA